jgi:hypothetical protein
LQFGQKARDGQICINAKKVGIRAQKGNKVHLIGKEASLSFSLKRLEVLQRNPRLALDIFQGNAFMFTRLSQHRCDRFHTLSFFPLPPTLAWRCRLRTRFHE